MNCDKKNEESLRIDKNSMDHQKKGSGILIGELINSMCNSLNTAVVITDKKGVVQYISSVAKMMLEVDVGDQISNYTDINSTDSEDKMIQIKAIRIRKLCQQFLITKQYVDNRLLFVFEPINEQENASECSQPDRGTAPYVFDDIIGLDNVKTKAANLAETACNILIVGETGTGKELFASAIHNASPRAHSRYVTFNCAAVPDTLFESELFGHKKGAFTDAQKDQLGLMEYADKGTLLLDEIGEMPLNLQAKILRVVETQRIRPLGYNQEKKLDMRFIFSTNSNLAEKIKLKLFREDLYYRISMITVRIPPLRERVCDIPPLICKFLKDCQVKYKKHVSGISNEAIGNLMHCEYFGNVRELEGIIHSAYLASTNGMIEINDLCLIKTTVSDWGEIKHKAQNLRANYIYSLFLSQHCDVHKTSNLLGISAKQVMRYLKQIDRAKHVGE